MTQDVYVIGTTGKVGRTLIKQIYEKGDTDPNRHATPTRIVGIASSSHTLYMREGISKDLVERFVKKDFGSAVAYNHLSELLKITKNEHKNDELVFVDVTAVNEPMSLFHLEVMLGSDYGLVTANKNPLVFPGYTIFQYLTSKPRRYGYRCSVMAGADAVPFLQDLKDLNDAPKLVEGCFSGTLGYTTSELEKEKKFSDIIREAYRLGFTEPHPRDDLSGIDVGRKLVVLARTTGYDIGIWDVQIKPFIPKEFLLEDNITKFLERLTELDEDFQKRMVSAQKRDHTLRYVAKMDVTRETPKLEVSLQEVPKQSPLGHLEGTLNKIVITSEVYPNGYSIEAPGAGLDVTARNIRRDLIYLLHDRENKIHIKRNNKL